MEKLQHAASAAHQSVAHFITEEKLPILRKNSFTPILRVVLFFVSSLVTDFVYSRDMVTNLRHSTAPIIASKVGDVPRRDATRGYSARTSFLTTRGFAEYFCSGSLGK